jgi:hypothetical protein
MAKTAEQIIDFKPAGDQYAFPVANGETIYKGTLAVVDDDGYLRNLTSTYAPQAKVVVFVADGSANASGPAATSAAGSISGSLEKASAISGDKTVRLCYVSGQFLCTFTSIAQSQLFKTVYATDNFTLDEAQNSGVKVGSLSVYISATSGWVDLNKFYQHDGTVFWKQAITRSSGGGGLFNIANPTGATIMIERCALDITTASSAALTIDVGVAATGTSNDSLIDGVASSVAGVFDNITDAGTNGGASVKCTSAQFITGTLSGASGALLAGSVGIWYRYWE